MRMHKPKRLNYANVMSTLAMFIALGGSSYAAYSINGRQIKDRTITGRKVHHNSLTGVQVRESTLSAVPRALNAAKVGGVTAQELKVTCPADTFPTADVCVERTPRPAAAYGSAVLTCLRVGTPQAPGRRLPTDGELLAAFTAVDPAPGGELTSNIYPSSSAPGQVDALYIADKVGTVGLTPDTAAGAKPYRCVTDPLN